MATDDVEEPLLGAGEGETCTPWWRDEAAWGGIFTLSMTTIGVVVLSLPAAVATIGWAGAIALLLLFAVLVNFCNLFLVRAQEHCAHHGDLDYEGLGRVLLGPRWAIFIRVTLLLLLVGATTSVNMIVVDMVLENLKTFGLGECWFASKWVVSLAIIVLTFPLTVMRDLSKLGGVSLLGLVALAYVFLVVAFICLTDPDLPVYVQSAPAVTLSLRSFLGLPIFACVYCAQFQVLGIYHSIPPTSRKHMSAMLHVSTFGIAMPIYFGFALLPYFALGPSVQGDFLNTAWANNRWMTLARIMLGVINVIKYPLLALPLRDVGLSVLWPSAEAPAAEALTDEASAAVSTGGATLRSRILVMGVLSVLIFSATGAAAGLGEVTDITGASCGMFIMLVFPSLFYLACKRAPDAALGGSTEEASAAGGQRLVAAGICALGLVLALVCFTCSLMLPGLG